MDIDLRRLRFFVEVVRQGGFSHAAKVMFATQSAVSKAVRQLEEQLGSPLLQRIGHRSELTAAGRIVYDRALDLLTASRNLAIELDELRGLKRGTLRLGFPRLGSTALFAAAFANFRRDHPGIEVQMEVHEPGKLEALLQSGELDLAALIQPVPAGFEWQHVRREPLVAILPRGHPLAAGPAVGLASLAATPFILAEEGLTVNRMILAACRTEGIEPQIALRTGQLDFLFELVAAGLGVAFLPRAIAQRRHHPEVASLLLDAPACHWDLVLAWRQGSYLPDAARAWLAQVEAEQGHSR